jgi:hypothetical protein
MDNVIYSGIQAYPLCKVDAVLQVLEQICKALVPKDLRDMAISRSYILDILL